MISEYTHENTLNILHAARSLFKLAAMLSGILPICYLSTLCPGKSSLSPFSVFLMNKVFHDPHRLTWAIRQEPRVKFMSHYIVAVSTSVSSVDMTSLKTRLCLCLYGSRVKLTAWHVMLNKCLLNE